MATLPAHIVRQQDLLMVNGELDFMTVVPLWKASLPLIAKLQTICFDFSRVTHCNSAGIALMVEWVKLSQREKKSLQFQNIPEQLLSIIRVSGVESFLVVKK